MAGINKLIKNLTAVDFEQAISDALHDNAPALVKEQQDQMLHGENALGEKIGKYKNKYYRRKKFDMNPLAGYGNVDLKLKGEFQRNTKVFFFSRSFFFNSTDAKRDKLVGSYGEEIFGLNKKYTKQTSKDIVAPEATLRVIKQIHSS